MIRRYAAAILVAAFVGAFLAPAARPAETAGDARTKKFFRWDLGGPADLDTNAPAHFTSADRVAGVIAGGGVSARLVKPNVFQSPWVMPAFDIDRQNHGAIDHPFYLAVRFRDVQRSPAKVWTSKGGTGLYGKGYAGRFGGAGDGKWKTETVVIRRSVMRSADGRTFGFSITDVKAPLPVDWMTLFSADARDLDEKEALIAGGHEREAKMLAELRRTVLPKCRDLGLPAPGPEPGYTAEEKARGLRLFFPPVHRQLFANSQPRAGEMTPSRTIAACPGETRSLLVAVRALKDAGALGLLLTDAAKGRSKVELSKAEVRWARYAEAKIGSSWGKTYRVCPERLTLGGPHAKPERLEIACVTVRVPEDAPAGDYAGTLTVTAAAGGSARVPLTVRVYPFRLERPEHSTHGLFYYMSYADYSPFEIMDMADHGMDMVVSGMLPPMSKGPGGTIKRNMDPVKRCFRFLKSQGYRSPVVCSSGGLTNLARVYTGSSKGSDGYLKGYESVIGAIKAAAEAEGFTGTGFFPIDEPHKPAQIAVARDTCTWTHRVPGAKTYITSNPGAVKVIQPVLDYVCYNLSYIRPETVEGVRKAGATLMFYCPSFDVDPERNRFRAGFYLSKLGAHSAQFFAYQCLEGNPFFDMDGGNRDWNVAYPSMDSPKHDPTLQWEAMREGVYDFRYAWTLSALAARLRAGGDAPRAGEAETLLAEILAPVEVIGKSSKTPELAIEANVDLKNRKIDPAVLRQVSEQMPADWYETSRARIARAVIRLGGRR